MRLTLPGVAAAVALSTAACGAADKGSPNFYAADDTAGAVVVNNPSPHPSAGNPRLAWRRIFTVGPRDDSRMERELWNVVDAVLTGDRQLIVAMHSGAEIRVFDTTANFVRTVGGIGDGPGEFQRVSSLGLGTGDTIFVVDRQGSRVLAFNARGVSFGSSQTPATRDVEINAQSCCFSDGSLLVRRRPPRRSIGERDRSTMQAWLQVGSAGALREPEIPLPAGDVPLNIGPVHTATDRGELESFVRKSLPFARLPQAYPFGDRILFGAADRFEYRILSRGGTLQRIVRADFPPAAPTGPQLDEATQLFLTVIPPSRDFEKLAREELSRHDIPATMPAYGRIYGANDGSVWIQNYAAPGSTEHWWARFDADGKLVGTLELPREMRVVRFFGDYAIVNESEDADGFARIGLVEVSPTR